jgi:hypothetical protein
MVLQTDMNPVSAAKSEEETMKEKMSWTARMVLRSKWKWTNQRTTETTRATTEDSTVMSSSTEEQAAAMVEDGRTIGIEAKVAIVDVRGDGDTDEYLHGVLELFHYQSSPENFLARYIADFFDSRKPTLSAYSYSRHSVPCVPVTGRTYKADRKEETRSVRVD